MSAGRRWVVVGVTLAAALLAWWVNRPSTERGAWDSPWPYPPSSFISQACIWRELGLRGDQVHLICDNSRVTDWTPEEKKRFGYDPGWEIPDFFLRCARLESGLSEAQRARFRELQFQAMDTLAAEIPKVAAELALTKQQKAVIEDIAFYGAQYRDRWTKRGMEDNHFAPPQGLMDLHAPGHFGFELQRAIERSAIRGVLQPEQLAKLEALKGAPGPISEDWRLKGGDENSAYLLALRDPAVAKELGLDPTKIAEALSAGEADAAKYKDSKIYAAAYSVCRAWQLLNQDQRNRLTLKVLPHLFLSNALLRKDVCKALGITDNERDRLTVLYSDRRHAIDDDQALLDASTIRLRPSESESQRYYVVSGVWEHANRELDIDPMLWAFLRPETKAKYLALGGKVPKPGKSDN